jgi:hypothetical protein
VTFGSGRLLRRWAALSLAIALSGCFYDSRWGQATASQKRVAASLMPSQLRTDPHEAKLRRGDEAMTPVSTLRVRAYATPHYASALVDGEAQLLETLQNANPELAQDLSIRLELADYRVWASGTSDDDLSALLTSVAQEDPATDVDWVLVLASPRNMVALGPDELGVGSVLGRYLAIRAMSDAAEYDSIQRSFTKLSDDEKHKLYDATKRHKSATVLLHEIGHTLGMPHELDPHSLMSPRYDSQSSTYSTYAARIGRRALELRASTPGTVLHQQSAQAALNALHAAPEHTFEPKTAAEVERLFDWHLKARPARTAVNGAPPGNVPPNLNLAPAPAPPSGAGAPAAATGSLAGGDRALFDQARQAQAAGHVAEARAIAQPLFERYASSYAVQELRCQLAMQAQLAMSEEQAECQPLMRLSGSGL